MAAGAARVAPAAERNKEPIKDVLLEVFAHAAPGKILEVACGTGQHAAFFSKHLPGHAWLPTNLTDEDFDSVAAHNADCENVAKPMILDTSLLPWPVEDGMLAGVVCVNMTHIAPFAATTGLLQGAAAALRPAGTLFIYGPFMVDGKCTTASNQAFHESLQSQNPSWGYRDIADLRTIGQQHGLELTEVKEMPANNFALIFSKSTSS